MMMMMMMMMMRTEIGGWTDGHVTDWLTDCTTRKSLLVGAFPPNLGPAGVTLALSLALSLALAPRARGRSGRAGATGS
jgi:hypothetical protein